MIDVTNEVKERTQQEILYADDLVLIAETMAELPQKIIPGKVHFRESPESESCENKGYGEYDWTDQY